MIQLCNQIIHYDLGRTYYKMSFSKKIKTINKKIEQNVGKYEFLTGKDVLPKKDLLEKADALKRFEYSPLGKKLKAQTSAAEK